MDAEWLNNESIMIPPGANPDDDFRFSCTINPTARNYLNAKTPKPSAKPSVNDPYSPPPPQLKPQIVKCDTVEELRRIIYKRYSRALIGRPVCDNMSLMLVPGKDRTAADVTRGWRLVSVTVVDFTHYFYLKHSRHLDFFCGTEIPDWIATNKNYLSVSKDTLRALNGAKDVKFNIARLGFHLQIKLDYDDFVKAVRAPQNTDRAGFPAQVDINAIIREAQATHPNLSRQPLSSWQQWAAEVAALPRDRHAQALQNGPPSTLPFVAVESEAERRLANVYESNVFLEHITTRAAGSFKKVDEFLDQFIIDATKEFEKSLRAAASKGKEELATMGASLSAQAEVAWWNTGRLAPEQPSMPSSLLPLAARQRPAEAQGAGASQAQDHQLQLGEDALDLEHQESGDEESVDDDGDDAFIDVG